MLIHFHPYERPKLEIISLRTKGKKVLRMLLNGNMYLAGHQKKQSLMFLREIFLMTVFNVRMLMWVDLVRCFL